MGFIKKRQPPAGLRETFNTIIHTLIFVLSELGAGPIEFQDVLGVRRQPMFKEFRIFLQMLEVYGSGYGDDVDYFRYNLRNDTTHTQSSIEQLQKIIQCYELALSFIDMHGIEQFHPKETTYAKQFQNFLYF